MKNLIVIISLSFLVSCSHLSRFNSIEGKVNYDEHYATVNGTDYESGEQQGYGVGITGQVKNKKELVFDYGFYPDFSFETSRLVARTDLNQQRLQSLKTKRVNGLMNTRGVLFSPIGRFELNVGVGASYFQAYNDTIDTSKVEAVFKYEGVYTLMLFDKLYASVSFLFQESPGSTYGEYYSLVYKLGYVFMSF